jgi:hypothetical protein
VNSEAAVRPCLKEFVLDLARPSADFGPVLFLALRRFAALCFSVVMFRSFKKGASSTGRLLIAGIDRTPAERELLATGIDSEERPIVRQARKERPPIPAREADGAARSAGVSRQQCEHDAEALAFRLAFSRALDRIRRTSVPTTG